MACNMVEFKTVWRDTPIYVNPAYVRSLRPAYHNESVEVTVNSPTYGRLKSTKTVAFPIAGHTRIEFNLANEEGEFSEVVFGDIHEVAGKLYVHSVGVPNA